MDQDDVYEAMKLYCRLCTFCSHMLTVRVKQAQQQRCASTCSTCGFNCFFFEQDVIHGGLHEYHNFVSVVDYLILGNLLQYL